MCSRIQTMATEEKTGCTTIMTKFNPPTRNFLRTFTESHGSLTVNVQGQRVLDLVASYGGIVNFVKHTHLENSGNAILDIGFKLLNADVDSFLKEEVELH